MRIARIFFLISAIFMQAFQLEASGDGDSRVITQIYSFEAGAESALDTYLSPLRYHGFCIGLGGKWSKVTSWKNNSWMMDFDSRMHIGLMRNPARTSDMIDFRASFRWCAAYRFQLPDRVLLTAGVGAGINAGVVYLPGNGNNPASVKADAGIGLRGSVSWPFKIGKLDVLLSDEVYLPSLSMFFSPQFGETYYEIYLGNHDGLVRCGWWGNHFSVDNLLAFDLDIGPSALRLGYRFNAGTSWVSHINTQIVTNSFVIGWIPGGIGLHKTKASETVNKIVSLY